MNCRNREDVRGRVEEKCGRKGEKEGGVTERGNIGVYE